MIGSKTMISFKSTPKRMLFLLTLTLFAILTNATQRYDIAQEYPSYERDEPILSYIRPQYSELGISDEDVGRSELDAGSLAPSQGALVSALIDRWLESAQADADGRQSLKKREHDDSTTFDINSHLPPTRPFEEPTNQMFSDGDNQNQIRGPVNDPEESEAKLSELTNALNHRMSNSLARQQLLLSLLNSSSLNDNYPEFLDRLNNDKLIDFLDILLKSRESRAESGEDDVQDNEINSADFITSTSPADEVPTSEYIDHPLALFGHQMVQGGAGEGRQLLGPDGTFENIQVIKTDSAIPSYCDPPNPCPLGYTAADGCIENFINSASFSREYQAKQKCSCDNEHSLFNCASPMSADGQRAADEQSSSPPDSSSSTSSGPDENKAGGPMAKLDTLARTIQNRFGDLASVRKLISDQQARHQQTGAFGAQNDNEDSNYLVRSARKWSPNLNYHKMELD